MAMSIRTKEDSVRAACAVAKGEAVVCFKINLKRFILIKFLYRKYRYRCF